MANPFVHIELQTQDLDKSKKFYAAMFSWKLEEIPGMDYTMINVGEGTGGGMMKSLSLRFRTTGFPIFWLMTLQPRLKKRSLSEQRSAKTSPKFRAWGGSASLPIRPEQRSGSGSQRPACNCFVCPL